jgi:hypothetical protein
MHEVPLRPGPVYGPDVPPARLGASMLTWHLDLDLQSWVYNTVMGAPHMGIHHYIGELAPRLTFTFSWR